MWAAKVNTKLADNSYRSISGYGAASVAVGRAMLCGFQLSVSAWRDAKYDAVLDSNGILFRIEIKSTATEKSGLGVTANGRAGMQIDKSKSKTTILKAVDSEFVVGVSQANGYCYVIPTELIEIHNKIKLAGGALPLFKEKWGIFIYSHAGLSPKDLRDGFGHLKLSDLRSTAKKLGVAEAYTKADPVPFRLARCTEVNLSVKEYLIMKIWLKIYEKLP